MNDYDKNTSLQTNNNEEEVLVTNAAIKTTDVLITIGAGAFALTGIVALINQHRKGKRLKEKEDFESRIIASLIADGASDEEIKNAKNILKRI